MGNIVAFMMCVLFGLFIILVLLGLTIGSRYLIWFQWRQCKHCGHHMEYKGLKEDGKDGYYLFHCPNCGAWEQILKEEFLRQMDTDNGILGPNQEIL